ncbi:unnamed protein product [Didymodactylos carnosus]|uniref:NAD(P)(+)--arginine ADP-ribosyltransferase n=1 Tax=Didymodactylos carnosus TaxID=1234261 RepID=A0A815TZX9_9BILA|nr:unnamed protein product [Didymodactylos carnosus]CAF1509085.1 unnamed protein product [Didymodactylos carnosus]CAF3993025.1 unnamed protein product [Didymodactylos carnosus]CAF4370061.1 unnamed protein product [Didymodactylos carnosus]
MATLRFFDVQEEPKKLLLPIDGYQNLPLMPLEDAVRPLFSLADDLQSRVWIAKENCSSPQDPLSQDEAAAIYLYTLEWIPTDRSLYYKLNQSLRYENRQKLIPWFAYLKLLLTALYKLPSQKRTIWRGVNADISKLYPAGSKKVWWGISSCTESVAVLESSQFLGNTGTKTLFSIECKNGKLIRPYSYYQDEDEILLPPATYLETVSQIQPAPGLHIIHLREKEPPHVLIQPPNNANTKQRDEWARPPASASPTRRSDTNAIRIDSKTQIDYDHLMIKQKRIKNDIVSIQRNLDDLIRQKDKINSDIYRTNLEYEEAEHKNQKTERESEHRMQQYMFNLQATVSQSLFTQPSGSYLDQLLAKQHKDKNNTFDDAFGNKFHHEKAAALLNFWSKQSQLEKLVEYKRYLDDSFDEAKKELAKLTEEEQHIKKKLDKIKKELK